MPQGGVVLVLTDEAAKTAWLVSRQSAESPLVAQPVQLPVLTVQQAYELWLLPPGEAAPMSMGLLSDSAPTQLVLPASVDALLQPGLTLAVSIEPAGGSPIGTPTGPVVFTGSVKEL
jgi:anti-sigma-K factor RskA